MYKVGEAGNLGIDSQRITEFISGEWTRRIALSVPWFYDWQFKQSPDNQGRDRCVVVVDENKQVVGFMGLNDRCFYPSNHPVKGAELTTWMISEKVRGMGYGKKILEYLMNQYDVLVGMGISEMAVPVYTQAGFKYLRSIPRYVRIFNMDRVKPFSQITDLGQKLIQGAASFPKTDYNAGRINAEETKSVTKIFHRDFNCFSRNPEHLDWRYVNHPVYSYEIYRVDDDHESAVVVLRTEEKESLKFVHVIDIYLTAESVLPAIVSFLEDFCRESKADFADFFCTADRIGHVFWYYGWFSILDDYYVQVPSLYYPIEMRDPPTTSLVLWSRNDMCSLLDRSRLYIAKGDCDLDRPTGQYLHERKGDHGK